jgi:hypothetical protein
LTSAAKQSTKPVDKPHSPRLRIVKDKKRRGQRAAQLVPVADMRLRQRLPRRISTCEMQTILLPRGNPAAVRAAGQGDSNRACATHWPPGDNRSRHAARVNGWSICRKIELPTIKDASRGAPSARELRRFRIFFAFRKKFAK